MAIKYDIEKKYRQIDITRKYKDHVNLELAEKIYNNLENYKEFTNLEADKKHFIDHFSTPLKNIIRNQKSGAYNIYTFSKYATEDFQQGRAFSQGLQGLERCFRHSIIGKGVVDLDCINAHPVFLSQIAKSIKVKMPTLNKYIENRDDLLIEIRNEYKLNRDSAKVIPIIILNGGSYLVKKFDKIKWLSNLDNEVGIFYNEFLKTEKGTKLFNHVKNDKEKKDNIKGSVINILLCETESAILQLIIDYLTNQKINISTLCHDGLICQDTITNEIIVETEKYVEKNIGLSIKLKIKPFDEGLTIDQLKKLDEIDKKRISEILKERIDINFSSKNIFIKAPMGYGKTTQLFKYLNDNLDKTIIFVTPRVALADEYFDLLQDLRFKHYKESSIPDYDDAEKLIIQIDSLHKIQLNYDIVIIDEIETTLYHLTNCVKLKKVCFNKFTELIGNSKKIIAMDANLNKDTVKIFENCFPEKKIKIDEYKFPTFENIDCQINIGKRGINKKHAATVLNYLKDNKKVACPVFSLSYLKNLCESINKALPDCKVLLVSSENKIKSVNEFDKYDLVIYTSTLQCGNNFNKKHFDIICPLISTIQSSAKLYSQQILRIRQFEKLHLFIDNSNYRKKIYDDESLNHIWKLDFKGIKELSDTYGIYLGETYDIKFKELISKFYLQIFKKYQIEEESAGLNLIDDIEEILKIHGFNIIFDNDNQLLGNDLDLKFLVKSDKTSDYKKIFESKEITIADFGSKKYDKFQYSKFQINKRFPFYLTYLDNDKAINLIKNVLDNLLPHDNLMRITQYSKTKLLNIYNLNELSNSNDCFIPKTIRTLENMELYRKAICFIDNYDILNNINDFNVSIDIDYKKFAKWYNRDLLYNSKIDLKKDLNISCPKIINKLLNQFGLKLSSIRGRENGVQVRQNIITTLIDYKNLDISLTELSDLTLYNLFETNKEIFDYTKISLEESIIPEFADYKIPDAPKALPLSSGSEIFNDE